MIGDSNRSVDEFGYMKVENCILTGEDVAKYFGYEIPFYEKFGLEKEKVYNVYRPKEEIKDSNFSNKPLLSKHADFSAEDYKYKLIVGTIGETFMDEDQTKGTVVFWDQKAIEELEKGKKYLSCGYMYDPIVEKGFYNNSQYDIKMTNIVANHVAMVDNPRYKRAIVADEQPISKGNEMSRKKKVIIKDAEKEEKWNFEDAMDELHGHMMDEDMPAEEKKEKFEDMKDKMKERMMPKDKVKDKKTAKDKKDETTEEEEEGEGEYGEGKETADDEELKDKDQEKNEKEEGEENAGDRKAKDKKMTGDSARIQKLVADSVSKEIAKIQKKNMAFDNAIREYERVCGKVNRLAFDSASKILDTILKNNRVTFDGKSFEQKEAMVEMLPSLKISNNYNSTLVIDSNSTGKSHTPKNILNFLKGKL